MIFKLSYLNSNLSLTVGYLNSALNNSALREKRRNKGGALICKYPNIWAPRRLFIRDYNTRNRNILRLSLCNQKLGKQGVCYHSLKDWNNLDNDIRNEPDIVNFKRSIFSRFFI